MMILSLYLPAGKEAVILLFNLLTKIRNPKLVLSLSKHPKLFPPLSSSDEEAEQETKVFIPNPSGYQSP